MLSRQIAQKLRGYETPFYLYDTALLRQTLESVVYESKKYGYKVDVYKRQSIHRAFARLPSFAGLYERETGVEPATLSLGS